MSQEFSKDLPKLELGVELGLEPSHYNMDTSIPSNMLNAHPQTCYLNKYNLLFFQQASHK